MRRSRDSVDREIAAWKDATKDTTTRTLWAAAVRTSATRKGAPSEAFKTERVRQIMHRAFTHGEPVYMAAEEIAFVAKAMARPRMAEPREAVRRAVAARYTRRDPKRKPHQLTFEGTGSQVIGRCACGEAFLHGLRSGTPRQQIRAQHARHLENIKAEEASTRRRFAAGVMADTLQKNLDEAWDDLRAADRALERGEPEARRRKDTAARELQQAIADARRHGFDTSHWEDRLQGMLA